MGRGNSFEVLYSHEQDYLYRILLEAKEKLDVLKLKPAEKTDYEIYQKALHRQVSLFKSSYVLGQQEGIEQGIEKERKNKNRSV